MNYNYDIILNWSDAEVYNFYEWNDTDGLELIKKIPVFKIKHKVFLDFLSSKIKVEEELLSIIQDKTLVSIKNGIEKLTYACLFTDSKNTLAIEFDNKGISINKSNLLIDDELNTLENSYPIKEININYEIIDKEKTSKTLRQILDVKRFITLEINNLYQNKDVTKLKYLYYEYKQEKCDDIDTIYQTFLKDIKNNFNEYLLKLYDIIQLSYLKA